MAAVGYDNKGNPDPAWWMEQVNMGIKFREKYAYEDHWKTWRRYYRGQWRAGILPLNLFFSFLRATVPRVYFSNPSVSVTPARPGVMEMAFAQVVNRIDNKMLHRMGVKHEVKMIVQDTFMFGTGCGKLGFGGRYTPTPGAMDGGGAPLDKGAKVEYDKKTGENLPWFARVPTGQLIIPPGLNEFRDARWVGHWVQRAKDDVETDERLDKTNRMDLTATRVEGFDDLQTSVEMVDLVEIQDFKTGQVIVLAPYGDGNRGMSGKVLFNDTDRIMSASGRFSFFPVQFNPDDEVFWGVPDAMILEPHQLEVNEIRTQMMKHRRLAIVKFLVQAGKIDESEIEKMLTEDVAAVVTVKGIPAGIIEKLQVAHIPSDLIMAEREVMQDVKEEFGFSRNQMGEYQSRRGDTSATEAQIVEAASEIRIDERRGSIADMIVSMVESMNSILFERWKGPQVANVVGPGGAEIWVKFDPAMLSMGHYTVRVDPDSSRPRTRQQRESKAAGIYNLLKENPMIDPEGLTRYLLTEIEGTEMDSLMRAMPPVPGQSNGPVDLPGFANIISQSAKQLPARAGR